jgi:hypothetical protein
LGSHFSNDGFFLVAIETQGLLLQTCPFAQTPKRPALGAHPVAAT